MDHLEAIVKLDSIIDNVFCEEIIAYCDKSKLEYLGVGLNNINKDVRNVLGKHICPKKEKFLFNKINKKIEEMYVFYKAKFPKINNKKINQIDLLKYKVGGKYEVHTDTMTDNTRNISVIINLNDDYEGADLLFVNPMKHSEEIKQTKLKKGTVVFFPSNFMYPHGIQPITKGTRYSIVSWLQ
tara:strand:+ start:73 stop:621 length:549 start_codon:yes stop_codon:yes gene_type:complete